MHFWGDKDFDWEALYKAIDYIDLNLVRWGRVNIRQSKEKFGTARIYCSLGWYQFHNITHPRSCFSRYSKWLWKLDCKYGSKIISPLRFIIIPYHKWLYRKVYYLACKKYPHIKREICCTANYIELLDFYK